MTTTDTTEHPPGPPGAVPPPRGDSDHLGGRGAPPARPPQRRPRLTRPASPDGGPGRWLRVLAGVREEILDWIPALRPTYTGLGSIVLATSCLAALAMFTALTKVSTAPRPALIPVALFWGWVIFSLDRWLITSMHGAVDKSGLRRLAIFVPRMILAVIVALTIAEPVVLLIFQPTLDRQVRLTQQDVYNTTEAMLTRCNPVTGVPNTSPACRPYQLTLTNQPGDTASQLASTRQQQAGVQKAVDQIQARIDALTQAARQECAGASGAGLSGTPGAGFRCKADWAQVAAYKKSSGLAQEQQLLTSLNKTIKNLTGKVALSQQGYSEQVQKAIDAKLRDLKNAQLGQIGIIDEWNALEQLAAQNSVVNIGAWLIRLTFIVLDCLPISAKLMGGSTAYDRRLAAQIASDEKVHDHELLLRDPASRKAEVRRPEARREETGKLDPGSARRLNAFLAENPGLSRPAAVHRLAEEGLRTAAHPGIVFLPGPSGSRRAALLGGPEVWEIVREMKLARAIRPPLSPDAVLAEVAQKTETGQHRIGIALRYAKAYPQEIAELVHVANAYDKARERGQGLG